MKASIIIPAYNAERTIAATVRSCMAQDFPDNEYEIIVVDDGSTDATAREVRDLPVRYIAQENAGAAAARNTGIRSSEGIYTVFIDSDCVLAEDVLSKLVQALKQDAQIGVVGGIYAPATDESLFVSAIYEEIRYRHMRSPKQVEHIGSFCMATRKEILEEVDGFNPGSERTEDTEISYEIARQGYRLELRKDVVVVHDHPRTLIGWLKDQFLKAEKRVGNVLGHSKMFKSDGYVNHRDWVSLLLSAATIGLLPFIWLSWVKWVIIGCIAVSALLQVPVAVFAIRYTGDWRHAIVIPMQVIRGWVWAIGAVAGIVSNTWQKITNAASANPSKS